MMSVAAFIGQLALASIMATSFQQGGLAHAGWLPVPSIVMAPRPSIEPSVPLTEYISQVEKTLQDLESMPSCNRVAYKTLVNACGSYDKHSDDIFGGTDQAVENYREIFAIQMTACELEGAQQNMPAACQPLLQPLTRHPGQDISDCKSALYATTNHWTSHEHKKHHGTFLCHTWRTELDKGEQLENLKGMLNAVKHLGIVVTAQLETLEELKAASAAVGAKLRTFIEDLQIENTKLRAEITRSFSDVAKNISVMGESVESLRSPLKQVEKQLQQHAAYADDVFERMASLTTNIDSSSTGVVQLREDFEQYQAMVRWNYQQLLDDLHKKVGELDGDVARANAVVAPLASQLGLLSHGVDTSLFKVQGISYAADEIQGKFQTLHQQTSEMEVQTNNTRENIEIFNEHAERVSSWATSASSAMDKFDSVAAILERFGVQYALVVGLLLLALSYIGIDLLRAIAISLILGIPIAKMTISPLMSFMKPVDAAEAVFQDEEPTQWRLIFYGVCAGILIGCGIKAACEKLMKRSTTAYDPASPPVLPISKKYSI